MPPSEFPMTFSGVRMDISWNQKLYKYVVQLSRMKKKNIYIYQETVQVYMYASGNISVIKR